MGLVLAVIVNAARPRAGGGARAGGRDGGTSAEPRPEAQAREKMGDFFAQVILHVRLPELVYVFDVSVARRRKKNIASTRGKA